MRREKRLAYALLAWLLATPLLLIPRCAKGQDLPACQQEPGRVCCTDAAFGSISTALVDLKGKLDACEARPLPAPACTLPSPPPAPSTTRPLLGLGASVVSTLALVAVALAPMPTELRGTLTAVALTGFSTSIYLVLP